MVNKHKLGVTLGAFAGLMHLGWSLLVWSGYGGAILDFVLKLHFLNESYTILDFSFGTAISLVIVTAILGYLAGWVLGALWNWVHR